MLLLLARLRPSQQQPDRRAALLFAAAGFALAVHFGAWIGSLDYTTVAVSTLLVATTPIWTAGYDAVVHRRGLHRSTLLAFAGGGIGLLMVVGFDRTPAPYPGHEWEGSVLALLGAAVFGAYLILVRAARSGLSTRTIVTHTYSWAAGFLLLGALVARQPFPGLHDGGAWAAIGAMALISQLLGHTALNASLRWFSPSAISFANLLEPVLAAALALAFFREPVPPLAVAGAVVLLASVFVVVRDERQIAESEL